MAGAIFSALVGIECSLHTHRLATLAGFFVGDGYWLSKMSTDAIVDIVVRIHVTFVPWSALWR